MLELGPGSGAIVVVDDVENSGLLEDIGRGDGYGNGDGVGLSVGQMSLITGNLQQELGIFNLNKNSELNISVKHCAVSTIIFN